MNRLVSFQLDSDEVERVCSSFAYRSQEQNNIRVVWTRSEWPLLVFDKDTWRGYKSTSQSDALRFCFSDLHIIDNKRRLWGISHESDVIFLDIDKEEIFNHPSVYEYSRIVFARDDVLWCYRRRGHCLDKCHVTNEGKGIIRKRTIPIDPNSYLQNVFHVTYSEEHQSFLAIGCTDDGCYIYIIHTDGVTERHKVAWADAEDICNAKGDRDEKLTRKASSILSCADGNKDSKRYTSAATDDYPSEWLHLVSDRLIREDCCGYTGSANENMVAILPVHYGCCAALYSRQRLSFITNTNKQTCLLPNYVKLSDSARYVYGGSGYLWLQTNYNHHLVMVDLKTKTIKTLRSPVDNRTQLIAACENKLLFAGNDLLYECSLVDDRFTPMRLLTGIDGYRVIYAVHVPDNKGWLLNCYKFSDPHYSTVLHVKDDGNIFDPFTNECDNDRVFLMYDYSSGGYDFFKFDRYFETIMYTHDPLSKWNPCLLSTYLPWISSDLSEKSVISGYVRFHGLRFIMIYDSDNYRSYYLSFSTDNPEPRLLGSFQGHVLIAGFGDQTNILLASDYPNGIVVKQRDNSKLHVDIPQNDGYLYYSVRDDAFSTKPFLSPVYLNDMAMNAISEVSVKRFLGIQG